MTRLIFLLTALSCATAWKRYERRSLACTEENSECILGRPGNWSRTVECRTEDIPLSERVPLNKNATHRIACPLDCKPHIVQKDSAKNRRCASFQTFGKYFDKSSKNWYVWFCDPCKSSFTTDCEFQE